MAPGARLGVAAADGHAQRRRHRRIAGIDQQRVGPVAGQAPAERLIARPGGDGGRLLPPRHQRGPRREADVQPLQPRRQRQFQRGMRRQQAGERLVHCHVRLRRQLGAAQAQPQRRAAAGVPGAQHGSAAQGEGAARRDAHPAAGVQPGLAEPGLGDIAAQRRARRRRQLQDRMSGRRHRHRQRRLARLAPHARFGAVVLRRQQPDRLPIGATIVPFAGAFRLLVREPRRQQPRIRPPASRNIRPPGSATDRGEPGPRDAAPAQPARASPSRSAPAPGPDRPRRHPDRHRSAIHRPDRNAPGALASPTVLRRWRQSLALVPRPPRAAAPSLLQRRGSTRPGASAAATSRFPGFAAGSVTC